MRFKTELVSAVVGLLLGGVLHWTQPYGETSIFGIHIWSMLGIGAIVCGLLLSLRDRFIKPYVIATCFSGGVMLSVIGRIVYDVNFWDRTSHNLAPFEIIPAVVIAFVCSLLAVYLGRRLGGQKAAG